MFRVVGRCASNSSWTYLDNLAIQRINALQCRGCRNDRTVNDVLINKIFVCIYYLHANLCPQGVAGTVWLLVVFFLDSNKVGMLLCTRAGFVISLGFVVADLCRGAP